jgi:hypothetical protein
MRVEKSFVKINFAIMNFFSKVRGKYTNNFFTFYKFEKFDRAGAKSFNLFLLPLKFIRRENVAMEHNVLRLCVCLPLAQGFNLMINLMGQIAQNRCYPQFFLSVNLKYETNRKKKLWLNSTSA